MRPRPRHRAVGISVSVIVIRYEARHGPMPHAKDRSTCLWPYAVAANACRVLSIVADIINSLRYPGLRNSPRERKNDPALPDHFLSIVIANFFTPPDLTASMMPTTR